MRKFLLTIIFFYSIHHLYAQENQESLAVLKELLNHEDWTIVYTDRPDSFILNKLEVLISRKKLFGFNHTDKKIECELTRQEKKIIKEKIEDHRRSYWKRNLFPNSRMISLDTLKYIMDNHQLGWNFFHKFYGNRYNEFIDPIFLKNNSIAICATISMYSGSAGHYEISLFKMESSKWQRWYYLEAGDW